MLRQVQHERRKEKGESKEPNDSHELCTVHFSLSRHPERSTKSDERRDLRGEGRG
jgi:hypothetical protein